MVTFCPSLHHLRALDSKKDVLHAIEAIEQVIRGRQDKATPFFTEKVPKPLYLQF